jgi:D-sedoheptulose 7-phosphate isomerase
MKFSIDNYITQHQKIFSSIDKSDTRAAIQMVVDKIDEGKKIITCGNGGSASTASHYITDWNKMYNLATGNLLRGFCLTDNVGLITAFGNDIAYESIFSGQLRSIGEPGDLLVVVSASGNSPNIIEAAREARSLGMQVLGVLGYDGGRVMGLCDGVFHVPSFDMQICEDIHLSFGHLVMKSICKNDIA